MAADYIRRELKVSGLVPLYDNGFQHFRITDKIINGQSNYMKVNGTSLKLDSDFAPFAFSQNNTFSSEVVFAGYGFDINEDSLKWNDYAGIDVKGKIVMILRTDPEIDKTKSPFINYNQILDSQKLVIEDLEKKLNEFRKPESFNRGVTISGQSDVVETTVPTRNVVMEIPGSDEILKDQFVIIRAHFDHLCMGGAGLGSRVTDSLGIHHGADDNASGVGMALELAQKLAATPNSLRRSIVVIAFAGEEEGMHGSKRFVDNSAIDLNKVNAMINLDMVGRMNANSQVQIGGVGTADSFKKMIYAACDTTILRLTLSDEGYGPSDHATFYGKNIPVLFITSDAHLDYHTPFDTWDKINYQGMVIISDLAYKIIVDLANMDSKLTFKEAGTKVEIDRGTRKKGRYPWNYARLCRKH